MRVRLLLVVSLLGLFACSSGSGDSGSGKGGSGGGGGGGADASPPGSDACFAMCTTVDGICTVPESACNLRCLNSYTLYPNCEQELDASNLCASKSALSDFQCDASGNAELKSNVCTTEANAVLACLNSK